LVSAGLTRGSEHDMLRGLGLRCCGHEAPPLWMLNTPQWGCCPQPVANKGSAQSQTNNKQQTDNKSD
jgi:hypothetical protein